MILKVSPEDILPVGHRVLIKVEPLDVESEGGILLTHGEQKDREKMAREIGTIVAIGPSAFDGRAIIDDTMKVGDKVLFKKYQGMTPDFILDDLYKIIDDEHIYGK